ncbi:MAG: PqqD family protein [Clostridia bacterium]|nr:PqqD family protein [Clostridia bacterium]MBN2883053.1 PqqD family protein [Clostridia bacterium]
MYAFNEKKAFCDDVDGQLIVLNFDTGAYYSFNSLASVVFRDLIAGYEKNEIIQALEQFAPAAEVAQQLGILIDKLLEKELIVSLAESQAPKEAMSFYNESLLEDGFSLHIDEFMDVADLLLMDPIHEVDPDVGWPQIRPEKLDE